jgi:hypothetical protein
MRIHTIAAMLFVAASYTAAGQNDIDVASVAPAKVHNNEMKFNIGTTLGSQPEFNYERFFLDEMSVGMAASVGVESNVIYQYSLLPYYRMYFGKKRVAGFFIEANIALVGQKNPDYNPFYDSKRTSTNFGAGFALGYKWVTRKGLVGEIFGGVGRLFGEVAYYDTYPRWGLSLGKQF